jgi:hypothetical protein
MNQKIKLILIAICGILLLTIGLWRYQVSGKTPVSHGAILRDRSDSITKGCDCTSALISRALNAPHLGASSTIAIMATGDGSTTNEPILLANFAVPVQRQVLEGRGATGQQRAKLIEEVKTQCEKLSQTNTSPIYVALKNAIEHLRSKGCGPGSNCFVYAQTDLEETSDTRIKVALNQEVFNKQLLPAPINNDGIAVIISGIAETTGNSVVPSGKGRNLASSRNFDKADRIRAVWLQLFTKPEQVTFEPFCATN